MQYRTILYKKENGIGVVCINRPPLNALNSAVGYNSLDLFERLFSV